MTFVDISAMHKGFCMKFYAAVKQSNKHFTTEFRLNVLENDTVMLLN